MTHTELLARLRVAVGNPSAANVADAELTTYLNHAYTQIATRWRFHRNRVRTGFSTVIGTSTYALLAADVELLYIWNRTNNRRLQKVSQLDMFRYDVTSSGGARGEPTAFLRDGNNIVLFPTPDGVYALERYTVQTPTALSAGGDTPILPVTWHELIVFWARWQFWDTRGDLGKAQSAYNAIELWLRSRPNEFDEEDATFIHGVEVPELMQSLRSGERHEDFHTSTW